MSEPKKPPRKRSNVFKAKKLAEATEAGRLSAIQKAEDKKSIPDKIIDILKPLMARIDPIEALAVLGATYLIKQGIDWSQKITASDIADLEAGKIPVSFRILLPITNVFLNRTPYGTISDQQRKDSDLEQKINDIFSSPQVEIMEWILSFTLAVIIIRNFSSMDNSGSIVSMAKGLLAL